jgi:hypothetical protein
MPKPQQPTDIDGYISKFPDDIQEVLQKVGATIERNLKLRVKQDAAKAAAKPKTRG